MEYQNLPDISSLAALRAVIEKGGVNEAARVLNIGQPAVTKRLRSLEIAYRMKLTERVGGRLRLTEAGKKVYLFAIQTLDRNLALQGELQSLVQGKTRMSLEVTHAIGERFLPDLMLRFSEKYPDYQIDSRLAYSRQIQIRLATGQTELALLENAPDHPDILVQKWMDDELWLVCGANHTLAGTDLLPVEELPKLSYVLREKTSSVRGDMQAALRNIGIEHLNSAFELGSTEAIIDILGRGRHVSFMPQFAVYDEVNEGKLSHIKVTGFRIMRTLWIARNRANLEHPVAEAFIALLRESH
ncbi:MAG: LysR family transcriptional regulator [Acidiferrobacterales bacterium]